MDNYVVEIVFPDVTEVYLVEAISEDHAIAKIKDHLGCEHPGYGMAVRKADKPKLGVVYIAAYDLSEDAI